ncbi:MAG: hypothetical protein LBS00_08995 [Synergistaceae bacterium]|nr:hypothetical protein [Synergistaceae bacterium]
MRHGSYIQARRMTARHMTARSLLDRNSGLIQRMPGRNGGRDRNGAMEDM